MRYVRYLLTRQTMARHYMARFALLGMVIPLFTFYSCSTEEAVFEELIKKETEVTGEETMITEDDPDDSPETLSPDEEEEIPDDSPDGPAFLDWSVSENELIFEFSLPVKIAGLHFTPVQDAETIEEDCTITVILTESPEPGQRIEVLLQVEDDDENTLDVEVSFRFVNTRVPELLINELRTEYSNPKAEFIELKMLSGGNLGALRVFAASNNKNPMIYEFEPVEVEEGEYVVLHLRKLDDSCIDEYGSDLTESGGADSSPIARDFWIEGSTKLLRRTDAVYVLDQDDNVLDAIMISEKQSAEWSNSYLAEAAAFLFAQGAWKSAEGTLPGPMDAVNSFGITATKSISRDETMEENTHTAADWRLTATSGATPGRPNN